MLASLRTAFGLGPTDIPGHGHHAHAHAHGDDCSHAAAQAQTPGHFLRRNPLDAPDFSEVCACCQGAVDLDELMTLKAAAPHKSAATTHGHHEQALHLPSSASEYAVAALTVWASVPGVYFGVQNFNNAHKNVALLDKALCKLEHHGQQQMNTHVLRGEIDGQQARLNFNAYVTTVAQSRSMQRFISVFAGILPLFGSVCILGSVVVPSLGAVGCGFLGVYCVSHMVRYLTFEWPRVLKLQKQLGAQSATALTHRDEAVSLGLEASRKQLHERRKLYPTVAAAFGLYGAGAIMLQASAAAAAPVLLAPLGAAAIVVGMPAVLYYNNGPIKNAYNKNADITINRLHCGTQQQILRRIGQLQVEESDLEKLRQDVETDQLRAQPEPGMWRLKALRNVSWGLSYGVTFGIVSLGRHKYWHQLKTAQLGSVPNPEVLVRAFYAGMGHHDALLPHANARAELYNLLHHRPEALAFERAALLDHFHARVATEGLHLNDA